MRLCFVVMSFLFYATMALAEGLPANPWLSKNKTITGNNGYIRNENTQAADLNNNLQRNYELEIQELHNIADALKAKSASTDNPVTDTQSNNTNIDTSEALKALGKLSGYMDSQKQNNVQNNENSADLDEFKQKFSDVMNRNKAKIAAQNSNANRKMNEVKSDVKREYNHYKSQLQSNYNSLKDKTRPLYDTMKKSVEAAEKATGVNF